MRRTLFTRTRLVTVLLVITLALMLAPTASAQGGWDCSNLPAEDCDTLMLALSNTYWALDSATVSVDLSIGAGDGLGLGDTTIIGTGAMVLDRAAAASDMYSAVALTLDATATSGGMAAPTGFTYVGGNAYWVDPFSGQWLGLTAADVTMAAADPASPIGAMAGPVFVLGMVGMTGDISALGLPTPLLALKYQRLDDSSMMGQTMYAFQFSTDNVAASGELAEMLGLFTGGIGALDPTGLVGGLLPIFIGGTNLTMDTTFMVGADDGFVHQILVDIAADVTGTPMVITLDVGVSDINSTGAISAPEGATMVTAESLVAG
jgi:hypothetical protein